MNGKPVLKSLGIIFRYPGFELRVEELVLRRGSITVLTGTNGSGKSTLLRLLSGLLAPVEGTIQAAGGSPAQCVLVHQNPYLLHGSVEYNVGFGLRSGGVPKADRRGRIFECLDAVGLSGFGKRRADKLSGGEAQRVALARALAIKPSVLLLDEPTSHIDTQSVDRLERIVATIANTGTSLVVASHDPSFVYRIADTIVALENGAVLPPDVNTFKGRVSQTDERFTYFAVNGGEIKCSTGVADARAAVVPYDDVILSRGRVETSAQNQIKGTVRKISPAGGRYQVDVDCGFVISSVITGFSVDSLGVRTGAELYVIFKASAVRLY